MSLPFRAPLTLAALIPGTASSTRPAEAQNNLTALYTADAVIFPERLDALTGQEAIKRYWTPRKGGSGTRHRLTPTRVMVDGKHAYDYGTYEVGGGWRIQLDMWNSGPEPGS